LQLLQNNLICLSGDRSVFLANLTESGFFELQRFPIKDTRFETALPMKRHTVSSVVDYARITTSVFSDLHLLHYIEKYHNYNCTTRAKVLTLKMRGFAI